MPDRQIVRQPVPRLDGPDKVAGRALYAADVPLPGLAWGRVLRSPVPHARLLAVRTEAARALPGVLAVLAAADLPDPERRTGRQLRDLPLLAFDRVRFVGERIAAVAAETREAADRALDLIALEYEELPAVFDPEAALRPGAPLLHPAADEYEGVPPDRPRGVPNLQGAHRYAQGDVEAGLAEADAVVEATYRLPAVHQGYLEPHAVTARANPDGSYDVWLSNKTPFAAGDQLAAALGVPASAVRIHPVAIGGDFGGKGALMDAPIACLLSRATGRPIRMVMTYAEELMAGNPRHSGTISLRMGARRDGRLTALDARVVMNGGAYAAFKPNRAVVLGGLTRVVGPYDVPNVQVDVQVAYTNTVPRGHMRAPGEPQVVFARESHLDALARRLGLDPLALRRVNLVRGRDHEGQEFPLAEQVLDAAARAIDWGAPRPPSVGRGIALGERGVGIGTSGARLIVQPDGLVELVTGVPDTGSGALTVLAQVVAETLGLPLAGVRVRPASTDEALFDTGAGGSRVTHVAGQATLRAAQEAARQLADLAAELFGWPADEVEVRAGRAAPRSAPDEGVPIGEVVRRLGHALVVEATYTADRRWSQPSVVAQAAEVEVDRETGAVRVLRLASAHDIGAVLNPIAHQGQIEGGVVQGLGYALMEELVISSDDGRVGTLSLGDYKLPTILDVPPLEVVLVPGAQGPGPFEAKSIGETSISGIAPAIANAVLDAVGVQVHELPIRAERVLELLDAAQGQSGH